MGRGERLAPALPLWSERDIPHWLSVVAKRVLRGGGEVTTGFQKFKPGPVLSHL